MRYPERFSGLPDYPFARLRGLLDRHAPGLTPIDMSIGEPKHGPPAWAVEDLVSSVADFGRYPRNDGEPELLAACAAWIRRRYGVGIDPATQLMALCGTREGLFNACLALCPEHKNGQPPTVLIPNPFYQVYAAGAVAAGAEPIFVPAKEATGYLPDFDALPTSILDRAALLFICSPSNPQGAVAGQGQLRSLVALAERHDFCIAADECYSEIYHREAPPGLLELADGSTDPERLLVFHSLSKRSGAPGLRSGFVAGGARAISRCKQLRAYGGAPPPTALQSVAARLWGDESHVEENRERYRVKHQLARDILMSVPGYVAPAAGFFLWLAVDDDQAAAEHLWRQVGLRVLPGSYLGRQCGDENPGAGHIRIALVADDAEITEGLERIRACLQ